MEFTHLDAQGRPKMVDVTPKEESRRLAVAKGTIQMKPSTLERIIQGNLKKGDVLSVAQTAGIMAVKKTWEAIPMCHNIPITGVEMELEPDEETSAIHITVTAVTYGKTGIEMEALHGVAVAALTIYDMCKAIDRSMKIMEIRLVEKSGGQSGEFRGEEY
jgi:cyclic pyranopterin phosphate synthase